MPQTKVDVMVREDKYLALHTEIASGTHETLGDFRICLNIGNGAVFIKFNDAPETYFYTPEELMIGVLRLKGVEPDES